MVLSPSQLNKELLNETLWRYVTLPIFIDMLLNKRLFFSSPIFFKDPWEGRISEKQRIEWTKSNFEINQPDDDLIRIYMECVKSNIYISCWHSNESESEAMWNSYSSNHGIAIVTKAKNVLKALPEKSNVNEVPYEFKKVQYFYQNEELKILDPVSPFFLKRESFKHENEVRVIIFHQKKCIEEYNHIMELTLKNPKLLHLYGAHSNPDGGIYLPIEPNELIEKIIIHPETQNWTVNLIIDTAKKLGFTKEINKSDLYAIPPN